MISPSWQTRLLLVAVIFLATYIVLFDSHSGGITDDMVDVEELEQEVDSGNPVRIVTYKSPLDDDIFKPIGNPENKPLKPMVLPPQVKDKSFSKVVSSATKYHRIWTKADRMITRQHLWPNVADVDKVLSALATASIINVDVLDIGDYESGTAQKWLATLEGGQKAILKIVWEEKGQMKRGALCNYGFESPTAEISAFHLHRILGFYNTPYVTGRKIKLQTDILPVASAAVAKQILLKPGNETCLIGSCSYCKIQHTMCPRDGIVEASVAFWIPRKLKLYTYPIKYMPYSTPRMDEWGPVGFNNRSYCTHVRKTIEPYDQDQFYYDLFDFAVIDTLMYHYDSKHYAIDDTSDARGLSVRLDHGRAFCAYDRDDEHVFLAPINQCCTLRKSTYENLKSIQHGILTKKLRQSLDKDPIAPILDNVWYPALERRLKLVLAVVDKCIGAIGQNKVLVVER